MSRETAIAAVLFPLLLMLSACSPGRAWESLLVLADVAAEDEKSLLQKQTPTPRRREIPFASGGEDYFADLYLPGDEVRAGILLVPGAAPRGKNDPRLVSFARTLARAQFAVLVPDIPSLREQRVHSGNIRDISEAFSWFQARPELTPRGRAGIAALSYAAGPAILASMRPDIRSRVRFILAVGGYYDLPEVLVFFATGCFRIGGEWKYLEPNRYGKWVFVLSNLDRIPGSENRKIFRKMAEKKMKNTEANVDDLASRLGREAKPLYEFLTSETPEEARRWRTKMPEDIREEIAALNLANKNLSLLEADLILIHGYEDNIIPYNQSVWLDRALPEEQANAFLVHGLAHVDLEPGLIDKLKLWRGVYLLLSEREKIPEGD